MPPFFMEMDMKPTITLTEFSFNEWHWCASIPFFGKWINIHAQAHATSKDEAIQQATNEILMKSNFKQDEIVVSET